MIVGNFNVNCGKVVQHTSHFPLVTLRSGKWNLIVWQHFDRWK